MMGEFKPLWQGLPQFCGTALTLWILDCDSEAQLLGEPKAGKWEEDWLSRPNTGQTSGGCDLRRTGENTFPVGRENG